MSGGLNRRPAKRGACGPWTPDSRRPRHHFRQVRDPAPYRGRRCRGRSRSPSDTALECRAAEQEERPHSDWRPCARSQRRQARASARRARSKRAWRALLHSGVRPRPATTLARASCPAQSCKPARRRRRRFGLPRPARRRGAPRTGLNVDRVEDPLRHRPSAAPGTRRRRARSPMPRRFSRAWSGARRARSSCCSASELAELLADVHETRRGTQITTWNAELTPTDVVAAAMDRRGGHALTGTDGRIGKSDARGSLVSPRQAQRLRPRVARASARIVFANRETTARQSGSDNSRPLAAFWRDVLCSSAEHRSAAMRASSSASASLRYRRSPHSRGRSRESPTRLQRGTARPVKPGLS